MYDNIFKLWHTHNHIPSQGQTIRYKDSQGIIHHGIFNAITEDWHVIDLLGGINTHWKDVTEWQGFDPLLVNMQYQNFIVTEIEAESG